MSAEQQPRQIHSEKKHFPVKRFAQTTAIVVGLGFLGAGGWGGYDLFRNHIPKDKDIAREADKQVPPPNEGILENAENTQEEMLAEIEGYNDLSDIRDFIDSNVDQIVTIDAILDQEKANNDRYMELYLNADLDKVQNRDLAMLFAGGFIGTVLVTAGSVTLIQDKLRKKDSQKS